MNDELIRVGLTIAVILLALAAHSAYRYVLARLAEMRETARREGYEARNAAEQDRHGLAPLPIEQKEA
jgi:hypothetical protein